MLTIFECQHMLTIVESALAITAFAGQPIFRAGYQFVMPSTLHQYSHK